MNDASPINLSEVKSFDYIAEANVTASNNFHGDKVPLYWFQGALFNAIKAIEQLDAIKKTLFYGRELTGLPEQHAITTGCQHLPGMVDPEDLKRGELLLHSIVGTVTEAGEQLEMLSNVLFNGAKFDDVNFIEEIGDGFWYAAIGLKQVNATFGDVQHRNIAKLRHRFPQKFTEYDANNRDLFGERKILEMQGEQAVDPLAEVAKAKGKQFARIDNWEHDPHNECLWGNVSRHPNQAYLERNGNVSAHVHTSKLVELNVKESFAETKNTVYRLGKQAA